VRFEEGAVDVANPLSAFRMPWEALEETMQVIHPQLITFIAVTLLLTVTPGVDTFIVMRNVLRGGTKDGVCTAVGICSGLFVHASLSALGISAVLVRSANLFAFVKMAGAVYLLWLGAGSLYGAIKGGQSGLCLKESAKAVFQSSKSFREGLLSNVLNPKPAVFYLAFFPQFIGPGDPVFLKSMLLASIQFMIGVAWLVLLSVLFFRVRALVEKPSIKRALDGLGGGILIFFGLKVGLQNS
jgi:threonine/homoserine/homoserine lactone efflux protein